MSKPLKYKFLFSCILTLLCKVAVFGQIAYEPATIYGGKLSFDDLIDKELVYPDSSYKNKVQGAVYLKFVIDEYGLPKKLSIIKGVNKEIDKEAVRLFNKLLWLPAKSDGYATSSVEELKINFNIREHKKRMRLRGYKKLPNSHLKVDTSFKVYELDTLDLKPIAILPNGKKDVQRYVAASVQYPNNALKHNISGTTVIEYIIEPSGLTSNYRIINVVGGGCSLEVIRVLKGIRFSPPMLNGVAVRTKQRISINFILPNNIEHKVINSGNYGSRQ